MDGKYIKIFMDFKYVGERISECGCFAKVVECCMFVERVNIRPLDVCLGIKDGARKALRCAKFVL